VSNLKIGKNVILDRLTYASSTVRTSSPWFISATPSPPLSYYANEWLASLTHIESKKLPFYATACT